MTNPRPLRRRAIRAPARRPVTEATHSQALDIRAADDLAERLAADLDGCFETLVRDYQDRLYAFALRFCGSAPDAEEIAQDAFIRAYRALRSYPADRVRALALRPWLYRITLNLARNRGRGRRLRLVSLDGEEERPGVTEPVAAARDGPEAVFERTERGDELAALVTALPARYRAAVVLRHVEGLSYREIADVLDQPVGTVKANTHRGIRSLREALTSTERRDDAVAHANESR